MLSTVATFTELPEAYILRGRLSAEGIPSWITHEFQIANNWFQATARHGAWVQVSAIDEADAFAVIRSAKMGEFKAMLAQRFGEMEDLHCPRCGAADCWKRRPVIQGLLAIFYGLLTNTIPPLLRWIYFCNACGARFHSMYGLIGKADRRSKFDLNFSEAADGDIPDILEVRRSVTENSLRVSPEEEGSRYQALLSAGGKGWVCRIGGFIRAFVIADSEARQLHALFVHPDFKRDGMGRHLHNAAVNWLFARDPTPIHLLTAPGTAAERFFRKAGWRLEDSDERGDYLFELTPGVWQVRRKKF